MISMDSSDSAPQPPGRVRRAVAVVTAYLGLGFVVAVGWPRHLFSHSYGGSIDVDAGSHIWYLWHLKEALLGRTGLFHTDRVFYPEGLDLINQDWEPVVGLLTLPLQVLGPVAAYNLQPVLAYALCGVATYVVCRRLGALPVYAFLAGLLFGFCEYRVLKAGYHGQPGYAHQQLIPLCTLAMLVYLERGRARAAMATGVCFVLATFCTPYQGVFLIVLGAGLVVHRLGTAALFPTRLGAPSRGAAAGHVARRSAALVLIAGLTAAVLVAPMVALNLGPLRTGVASFGRSDLRAPADLTSYVRSSLRPSLAGQQPPGLLAARNLRPPRPDRIMDERFVAFPSYLLLGLGLLALLRVGRTPGAGLWLFLAALFFVFSLGRTVTVDGRPTLDLPLFALLDHVPVLRGVRMASRFASMVTLCLAVAAALTLTHIHLHARPGGWYRRRRQVLAGVLILWAATELSAGRLLDLATRPGVPMPLPRTDAYRIIASTPGNFTVLCYPPVWETRFQVFGASHYPPHRQMVEQVLHGARIPTGTGDAVPVSTVLRNRRRVLMEDLVSIAHGERRPLPDATLRSMYRADAEAMGVRFVLMYKGDRFWSHTAPEVYASLIVKYWTHRAMTQVEHGLPVRTRLEDATHVLYEVVQ